MPASGANYVTNPKSIPGNENTFVSCEAIPQLSASLNGIELGD